MGAGAGSLDGRGSKAAWISRRLARSRVDAVTGRERGGRLGEHCNGWSGEVSVAEMGSRGGGRSATEDQKDSVRSSYRNHYRTKIGLNLTSSISRGSLELFYRIC